VAKIKLDSGLYDRVKRVAQIAGYPTVDDFIVHVLEKELSVLESSDSDAEVEERLRGLGYIE
jgi:hypothetical protein